MARSLFSVVTTVQNHDMCRRLGILNKIVGSEGLKFKIKTLLNGVVLKRE